MQPNVDEILNAGKAVIFQDRDGNNVPFDLVTARNFRETDKNRVMLVGRRDWEKKDNKNTTATTYDGHWVYQVFIYLEGQPEAHEDYTDFSEVRRAINAFVRELVGSDTDWELGDESVYEAKVSSREMLAAELEMKKFATRRF